MSQKIEVYILICRDGFCYWSTDGRCESLCDWKGDVSQTPGVLNAFVSAFAGAEEFSDPGLALKCVESAPKFDGVDPKVVYLIHPELDHNFLHAM